MKQCTCCKLVKDDSEFGTHTEKRQSKLGGRSPFIYTNSQCRKCGAEKANIRYQKNKNNPEFKNKNAAQAIKRYWSQHEKSLAVNKKSRDKKKNKERRKRYDKEHRDIIRQQSNRVNKVYIDKERAKISSTYAIVQLCHPRYGITREMVTPEMIELKKISIAIARMKRIIKSNESRV